MTAQDVERVRYHERQFLQADDFTAEQAYHRDMRRRHNLAHHTVGIVTGLELAQRQVGSAYEVWLLPGMAIDGYGREILVLAPYRLDGSLFDRFHTDRYLSVWIGYEESDAELPPQGWQQCDTADAYRRTVETWRLVVEPGDVRDDVVVDGRVLPDTPAQPGDPVLPEDASVPYQELPDPSAYPLWLLRLGTVHWATTDIGDTDPSRLNEERAYVGAVTAHVLAPGSALTVRPRTRAADPDAADFAAVEGRLRVDGRLTAEKDVHVNGGKVWLNDPGGPVGPPLHLQRTHAADGTGDRLRVTLGTKTDASAGGTVLSVGPQDGAKEKDVLAVRADDVVDVDTGTLRLGAKTRQSIDLWRGATESAGQASYGIGVQSSTWYARTGGQFAWFRGGTHADPAGDPGGGQVQLRLDDNARLIFDSTSMRQVLSLRGAGFGVGVQPSTLYFRSPGSFAWYRNGTESNVDGSSGGGNVAMALDASNTLAVNGSATATGNVTVGHNGDGWVHARHVRGKSWVDDSDDDLWLNWHTGRDVHVGKKADRLSNLHVAGGIFVDGAVDSVLRVRTYERALENGVDDPRGWSISLGGEFTSVYAAFAVLGGHSIWPNEGDTSFSNWRHDAAHDRAIPQHVFARVTNFTTNTVNGVCYCSESDETLESDNTVLFTVVVLGRWAP